jgi:hypothetical protein
MINVLIHREQNVAVSKVGKLPSLEQRGGSGAPACAPETGRFAGQYVV